MRSLILSLALLLGVVGVTSAQEPAPWLAVRTCAITPTEGPAARAALGEYLDYARAHPIGAPGTVYGIIRQRVNDLASIRILVEVESVAEWSVWNTAQREARQNDARRQTLFQAYFSHLVPQSCNWSFHQRWP